MPELPEVETVRRQLEPVLVGRRFERVEIFDPRLVRPLEPLEVAAELEGERVAAVERRGKYLVVRFVSGRVLLIHLRMTGNVRHIPRRAEPETKAGPRASSETHLRAVVRLDDGSDVTYRDVRRFGTWVLVEATELDPYLARRLGIEPLDPSFTPARLGEVLEGRRAPLKAVLLDQRTLAGVGNIYADEALWRARLHPLRTAAELEREDLRRLARGIKDALRAGIARQGATIRNYAGANGEAGSMQREFKVYGRTDEPCDRCGTPIEKTRVAGRGTSFCPSCQPLRSPRRQAARSSASVPARSRARRSV